MGEWAILLRWGAAGILGLCLVLYGRGCGKAAGLAEGKEARIALEAEVADLTGQLNGCITSVNFANHVADQAAAEADRQRDLASQAAARALLAEQERQAKVAALEKQLAAARKNPDAAAQLDIVLHPSIPLR